MSQFFLSLFISSTGLVLSPVFLMSHLPLLAMGAVAVVVTKTVLVRHSWGRGQYSGWCEEGGGGIAAKTALGGLAVGLWSGRVGRAGSSDCGPAEQGL